MSDGDEADVVAVSMLAFFLCLPFMCFGVIDTISMSDIVCASMI